MPRGEKIISEIAKKTEQFKILNNKFLILGAYNGFYIDYI
jgi:hypothetical protein